MKENHKWEKKLASSGFRMTTGRRAIINVLYKNVKHLSAEDIYMVLHPQFPNIGLTTVYRTLELLEQTGIAAKFEFGHGKAKYELTEEYSTKKHHHHLICRNCRTIIDYSDFMEDELTYIAKTESGLSKKYKFLIDNHIINFLGLCSKCRSK
ncbi:MAG: transcriptional repressor [Spirochaetales bacterium]|nr:transcriptional repressor [Spirochaetales bacterium]